MTSTQSTDTLDVLRKHRGLLLVTVQGLTDEQARLTPTVSALSLGGLVKHVCAVERQWADFVVHGAPDLDFEGIDWTNPPSGSANVSGTSSSPRRRPWPAC